MKDYFDKPIIILPNDFESSNDDINELLLHNAIIVNQNKLESLKHELNSNLVDMHKDIDSFKLPKPETSFVLKILNDDYPHEKEYKPNKGIKIGSYSSKKSK